jgi:pimeloyl-ACP methyl ester carboxylesterase
VTFVTLRARVSGDVELPYVDVGPGDGDPVVLAHAYADSWRSFERVLVHLPSSVRAITPTQRGHGDASKPASGYRIGDFAADLLALLDRLEVERGVLVASSSAVFTVEQVCLDHPERVRALVLIGAPWSLAERAPSFDFIRSVEALTDPVDRSFVRDFVVGTSSERVPADFLDVMVEEAGKVPAHVWKQTLAGLLRAQPPVPGAITVPTLVVWGDRDELIPREDQQRFLAAIPGARLAVHEGAGHVVHWERPEPVAAEIAAFVAELPS